MLIDFIKIIIIQLLRCVDCTNNIDKGICFYKILNIFGIDSNQYINKLIFVLSSGLKKSHC
jgi:hypothetical protein